MLNASKDHSEYVVDFYIVMEHIHRQITEMDSLSYLGKLYKLKLSTVSEAVLMSSFETSEPRLLTASGAHSVVNANASHFSHISSFVQWDEPLEGFKKRWKHEFIIYQSSQTETI